jgi:hypothetical protein
MITSLVVGFLIAAFGYVVVSYLRRERVTVSDPKDFTGHAAKSFLDEEESAFPSWRTRDLVAELMAEAKDCAIAEHPCWPNARPDNSAVRETVCFEYGENSADEAERRLRADLISAFAPFRWGAYEQPRWENPLQRLFSSIKTSRHC